MAVVLMTAKTMERKNKDSVVVQVRGEVVKKTCGRKGGEQVVPDG
jgi:hypothetical protein